MKTRIYRFAITICATFALSSCSDFLERSAQNLIIPTTASQYKELLQGEGYFKDFNKQTYFLNYMTDDMEYIDYKVENQYVSSSTEILNYVYCWANEIEHDSFSDGIYAWLYSQILVANTCLNGIDDIDGTEVEKKTLQGQALFQRAYAYFILVNTYGYPYNSSSAINPCFPLRLSPTPSSDVYPLENSHRVWEQIESDIQQAVILLDGYTSVSKYEINHYAALLLASRVELYMEKYTEAAQYATQLLAKKDKLYNISTKGVVEPSGTRSKESIGFLDYNSNPEILWNFCERGNANEAYMLYNQMSIMEGVGFRISQPEPNDEKGTLLGGYLKEENKISNDLADKRRCYFFNLCHYLGAFYPDHEMAQYGPDFVAYMYFSMGMPTMAYNSSILKYDYNDSSNTMQQAFRTAEAYLNLAEAYARQATPDTNKALYYLNELRKNRIENYQNLTMADFSTTDKLIQFIWDERRRELCFEECHRWWDLRRTTQPQLKHKWINETIYTLKQGDEAYVLSIPKAERDFDNSITNKRPVRLPNNN